MSGTRRACQGYPRDHVRVTRRHIEKKHKEKSDTDHLWNTEPFENNHWKYLGLQLSSASGPSTVMLDDPMEQEDLLRVIGRAMFLRQLQTESDVKQTPTPVRG